MTATGRVTPTSRATTTDGPSNASGQSDDADGPSDAEADDSAQRTSTRAPCERVSREVLPLYLHLPPSNNVHIAVPFRRVWTPVKLQVLT